MKLNERDKALIAVAALAVIVGGAIALVGLITRQATVGIAVGGPFLAFAGVAVSRVSGVPGAPPADLEQPPVIGLVNVGPAPAPAPVVPAPVDPGADGP